MRLAVFAKAPVPGSVKTRLVPLLGAEAAANLHAALVRHAIATAVDARMGEVELWCAPDERHEFFEDCARRHGVRLRKQEGSDLGERMREAFASAAREHARLILIGSDAPCLRPETLRTAAEMLQGADVVIGPAEDGGYVLVGMSRLVPQMFDGVTWGTSAVMAQTREALGAARVRWKELEIAWDVDRPEDYARLKRAGLLEEVLS